MDPLDYRILGELLVDASLSFVEIAKRVNTTPYTVRRRFERLKKEGTIQNCIVTIDLSKLGYQGRVFLLITVSPQQPKNETVLALKKIKNVITVTEIIGAFDLLAMAPVSDFNSIRTLVDEVNRAPNVERVEIVCVNEIFFPTSRNLQKILSKRSQDLAMTNR